ncbi:MAG: 50S ribosomal protein L25/general stress protein Ctc [Deltaproteobacteria bacterium CG12_big_fil_rev_8_21_14_0_65_43_10]|nr:MAG: 50S ribosomal protein L25/general stress protein Ctc [Deltaproteobacteria bacterium CG2_30_43_15]PIQ45978.1 MAG: 50S ribosomal protein L25/general stress protein Ctc [Deltaproteobacteria bacterium CG12_big_fil_rev_8_21_14_0_65_43_10]PIU85144.1 MAG: 50S ribosomal protein L25 [Deltaproteobacteria bacterium CG06_land_8_20_14_3_00_44_19]PIX22252.1 MAG: 50S ribosomal protein L25 [Deltaproteobacteria bacterium CG_4_8_14_3_um_filter_43_13]PIZ21116.1 MAG: 50S ribosomal protein L25 [Deltaproteob
MKQVSLNADLRTECGKSAVKKLRREGLIPAILYGHKKESIPLSLSSLLLNRIMTDEAIESTLIDLTIKAGENEEKKTVVLKDIQVGPVKRNCLHVDFYEVDMSEKIVVPISIHLIGKAKGVEAGGILQQIKREVEVKCLPSKIPGRFEIDVSNLEIGDSIHLGEISLDEGVEILEDLSLVVAAVSTPTVMKEAEEEMGIEENRGEQGDKEEKENK